MTVEEILVWIEGQLAIGKEFTDMIRSGPDAESPGIEMVVAMVEARATTLEQLKALINGEEF